LTPQFDRLVALCYVARLTMPPAAAFEEPLAELRHRIAELAGFPADGARHPERPYVTDYVDDER
jgi:hypothetical protein